MEAGLKKDIDKPRWDLLPLHEVEEVVEILTFGAKKYKPDNWKYVRPTKRYLAAAFRHLVAWAKGDKIDTESGKSHLAHAVCNLLFLMYFDNNPVEQEEDNGQR